LVPAAGGAGAGGGGGAVVDHGRSRRRFAFVHESIAELKKVEWPNRAQVVQGTVVVIIACAVVGLFLYLADLGLKPLVRDVFLNT
ncbi:MAG: preprotein translocase subunit SecE, partial [Actinobacteria bacterium]|nr:preprotein translocase subunit SecE [Actinomycetota bacterium]